MPRKNDYQRHPAGEPTGKVRLFCQYYVAENKLNGSAAAIQAGYAEASAAQTANKFLKRPDCMAYIAKLMAERSERTKIDSDWVLQQLAAIDAMELLDILNPDFSLKPLDSWPLAWRKYFGSLELGELVAAEGDPKKMIRTLSKLKGPDKQKNLELIGKHVDVGAFKERVEHDVTNQLAERMARAWQRVKERQP